MTDPAPTPVGARERVVAGIEHTHVLVRPGQEPTPLADIPAVDNAALAGLLERRATGAPDYHAPPIGATLAALRLAAPDGDAEAGHIRWFPAGVVLRTLICDRLEHFLTHDLMSSPVITPALVQWDERLSELAGSFRERIYEVRGTGRDDPMLLRYGADPGFFTLLDDVTADGAQMPWRWHEQVAGFRRNRSGELNGLQRTRSFDFFDCHSVCSDAASGMAEYFEVLDAQLSCVDAMQPVDHAVAMTAVAGDAESITAIQRWSDRSGRAVALELISRRKHYYRLLHNIYDPRGLRTMHGQLDDLNGQHWHPRDTGPVTIVHSATGSLERWVLVHLLDGLDAAPPSWPDWLAPVQVRILPVRPEHLAHAQGIACDLQARGVRTEIDDRDEPVRRRVRDSESRWIPYVAVVGDEVELAEVRQRGGARLATTGARLAHRLAADGTAAAPPTYCSRSPTFA
ncbi:His/Gly/Thr/Pro-type tRNA ligase C-terminal domain-containing protein [Jatrophihabitans lederbergiae]|uniref:His/Gly/Thr/Pro-type tRNA ligase C-terminal domain-containing protein n=1 Tax=Jatrophihabitans lederbergiae TaxID=3075547 RepID=A0ABU2JBU8_9ACTN|nr:His/Gly/Thr/Pro-type tRNA ligase C-terminal domain-containing protein [Jatrophihabitans sp. DSM 44399]MDT0262451.1 His/Gly/Thr/Pro-type tRNA ligase C-terminal domain-containing protein [Jatrophihabitans sp. DSM 44399]